MWCDWKLRRDREQTAHLQTALLHLPVRTQIRTAQSGAIRSTGLGMIAATLGSSSSPSAGLTCQCIFESTSMGGQITSGNWVEWVARVKRVDGSLQRLSRAGD